MFLSHARHIICYDIGILVTTSVPNVEDVCPKNAPKARSRIAPKAISVRVGDVSEQHANPPRKAKAFCFEWSHFDSLYNIKLG